MTDLGAEYMALMQNRLAILAVRARQKRENRVLRIPLYCEGHRTGVAIELMVMNEDGEGQTVPDHLLIYTVPDLKADKPGTAENGHSYAGHQTTGQSYTIHCGTCGRAITRQNVKLLRATIECVIMAGRDPKSGWRISIT